MRQKIDRAKIAAILEFNGGKVHQTARETGYSPATVSHVKSALEAVAFQPEKMPFAERFAIELRCALDALHERYSEMRGKDLAITVGILADKQLDYAVGRKGATVNVDTGTKQLVFIMGDDASEDGLLAP